jgi:hypothetical protein
MALRANDPVQTEASRVCCVGLMAPVCATRPGSSMIKPARAAVAAPTAQAIAVPVGGLAIEAMATSAATPSAVPSWAAVLSRPVALPVRSSLTRVPRLVAAAARPSSRWSRQSGGRGPANPHLRRAAAPCPQSVDPTRGGPVAEPALWLTGVVSSTPPPRVRQECWPPCCCSSTSASVRCKPLSR